MQAIRRAHKSFIAGALDCGDNLSLRLDKLNHSIDEPRLKQPTQKDNMLAVMSNFSMNHHLKESYSYAYEQWNKIISARSNCLCFEIESVTKGLLGIGNTSVHEFGVNLNRPWGVPYISGSTLKGFVSSYLARNAGTDWWRSRQNSQKSDLQIELFGGEQEEEDGNSYIGSVIFNDAWLTPKSALWNKWFVEDIVNVHYAGYYASDRLPDGTEQPVPVKIASMNTGLQFFVSLEGDKRATQFVKSVLQKALLEEGIGGKTSVGYGRFKTLRTESEELEILAEEFQSFDTSTLLQWLKEKGGKATLRGLFLQEAENRKLDQELTPLYLRFAPLKLIRLQFENQQISDLKSLMASVKGIKNNINKFEKNHPSIDIYKSLDARLIFDEILNRIKPSTQQIEENTFLSRIAYSWDEIEINEDNIFDIVDEIDKRTWPPQSELIEVIKNSALSEETKELCILELTDKENKA